MTEALDRYLEQCDKGYENYCDCVDQLDVQITRNDEDYEDICGYCGCIMPDDGTPCPCEKREDDD